jgi:formylglycine-generating enzyme required for sulfatase activity/serine/threonine protein kinase
MIDHFHALPGGYELRQYTVIEVLGFGGFGITYKARDENLQRTVAIKEYLPSDLAVRTDGSTVSAKSKQDLESFEWGRERFLDEARAVAQFNHPNIIQIYDFFEENGTGYIVMPYIGGQTLSEAIKQQGTLDEQTIRAWLWPVIAGLKVVHAAGYIHRDIKPQNIMMDEESSPILLDFGAARAAIGGRTQALTAIMTPGFAPWEQYETQGNQGPWTDIYALGAVMYCCIAGQKPMDVMDRLRDDVLEPPQNQSSHRYSSGLLGGVAAALALREEDRPQSLDDFVALLDSDQTQATRLMPPRPKPASLKVITRQERPVSRRRLYVLLTLLVGLVATWFWINQIEPPPVEPQANSEPSLEPAAPVQSTAEQKPQILPEETEPVAEPIAEPETGIRIATSPDGANVYINGSFSGHTPANFRFEPGEDVTVRVETEGFQTTEQKVRVPDEGFLELSWNLTKVTPKFSLTIQLQPADAAVRILNIEEAYEPGILLEPGRYQMNVTSPGYKSHQEWLEITDRDLALEVSLEAVIRKPAAGDVFRDCDGCPQMVILPAGSFRMGSPGSDPDREDDEGPAHNVRMTSFAMGRFEVTVGQYEAFVKATGYRTDAEKNFGGNKGCYAFRGGTYFGWTDDTSFRNPGWAVGERHPATCLSWNDARAYADWLTDATGKPYRLPSEAELEYANRAGSTTPYPWGQDEASACGLANNMDLTAQTRFRDWATTDCEDGQVFTGPVGALQANNYGLHDSSGNAWEWAEDCWHDNYLAAPTDGSAWTTDGDCENRVMRGGSWEDGTEYLRAAYRNRGEPRERNHATGFRVARDL